MLVRRDPDNPEKMFWDNLSFLWNVSGHRARLLVEMHGLLTISHSSIYQLEFDLNRNLTILPLLNDLTMPLNYSSGETLTVNSGFKEDILDVQLQYSYDYGKTWEDAASYSQNFEIPCLAKKQFAIRFNATDTMGNEYYYYTDPAALSRDVKVNLLEYNDTNILVKFTDIKDGNLSKTMVQCNINGSISFYMTDDDGLARINKPPLTEKLQLIFPSVGVYELKITEFYFRLKGDINSDGIVNINDIVLMSQAYGSKKGEPKWNPDADIAPPWNSIDIFDLVTCASYYGKKW